MLNLILQYQVIPILSFSKKFKIFRIKLKDLEAKLLLVTDTKLASGELKMWAGVRRSWLNQDLELLWWE